MHAGRKESRYACLQEKICARRFWLGSSGDILPRQDYRYVSILTQIRLSGPETT